MAFFPLEDELLPDDHPAIPEPGSEQQRQMLSTIEGIYDGDFERALDVFHEGSFGELHEAFTEAAVNLLRASRGDDVRPRVLDLGAGTGNTVARFLHRHGCAAEVRVHELSPVLLERAEQRLGAEFPGTPVTTLRLDLMAERLRSAVEPGSFDVVLVSNLLQLLARDRYPQIIEDVHQILTPGGIFASVFHLKLLAPRWKAHALEKLRVWWHEAGKSPQWFDEHVVVHFTDRHTHTTLPELFGWFQQAGFRLYDCPYRRFLYGAVVAIK